MPFQFTKQQRALAKSKNLPLIAVTVDARHCVPPGIKSEMAGMPDDYPQAKKAENFLKNMLKEAYVDRVKRGKTKREL